MGVEHGSHSQIPNFGLHVCLASRGWDEELPGACSQKQRGLSCSEVSSSALDTTLKCPYPLLGQILQG